MRPRSLLHPSSRPKNHTKKPSKWTVCGAVIERSEIQREMQPSEARANTERRCSCNCVATQLHKKTPPIVGGAFYGADNQIRTGDLVLTKDVIKQGEMCSTINTTTYSVFLTNLATIFICCLPYFKLGYT